MPEPAAGVTTAATTTSATAPVITPEAAAAAVEEKAQAKESKRLVDDGNKKPVLRARAIQAERNIEALKAENARLQEQAKSGGAFREKYETTLKQNAILAEAQKHGGFKNPQYLKLVDLSEVKLDGDAVKGAADAIEALKKSSPEIFGAGGDVKAVKPGVTTDRPAPGTHPDFDPTQEITPDQIAALTPEKLDAYLRARGMGGNRTQSSSQFGGGGGFVRGNGFGR